MSSISNQIIITEEIVISKILYIRGQKVMIDSDLAKMFEVTTKRLNEQVVDMVEEIQVVMQGIIQQLPNEKQLRKII